MEPSEPVQMAGKKTIPIVPIETKEMTPHKASRSTPYTPTRKYRGVVHYNEKSLEKMVSGLIFTKT